MKALNKQRPRTPQVTWDRKRGQLTCQVTWLKTGDRKQAKGWGSPEVRKTIRLLGSYWQCKIKILLPIYFNEVHFKMSFAKYPPYSGLTMLTQNYGAVVCLSNLISILYHLFEYSRHVTAWEQCVFSMNVLSFPCSNEVLSNHYRMA